MTAAELPQERKPLGGWQQLSKEVAAFVRDSIMAGQMKPGEFIRTERLAEELGVSATPVREALMTLQSEGSVMWEPRRGYRVAAISAQDIIDLYDVQAYIAGGLAARAAEILPTEAITHLQSLQTALTDAARAGDLTRVDELNHEIHRTINRAAGPSQLVTLLAVTARYAPRRFFGKITGWANASAHDHGAIFDALMRRDPDAASTAMADHIRHAGLLLAEHLREREEQ
ncbi:MAG TPA: GntR family transcriptional regulator [Streptosporangiaceae bacterium]|nr:GntR family transcriptional regulator [Streptosporangiaceae bacterium]